MKRLALIALPVLAVLALAGAAHAAPGVTFNLGDNADGQLSERVVQLILVITILSLAPSILIMTTSFVRIVVVLSLLRTALGLQNSPPNAVIISLSLFLTAFIMAPTFQAAWTAGVQPLVDGEVETVEAFDAASEPFKDFMMAHARDEDVMLFLDMAGVGPVESVDDVPLRVVAPAFMISELRRAFEIGFLIFIPFLVIDLVVASILMSMGMMMLPPVIISLPFKLIFFVLVDGWRLIAGSLVESFVPGAPG